MRPKPETSELIFCLSRPIFSKRCAFVVAPLFFLLPDTRTCAAFVLRSLQKQRCVAFRATTLPSSVYRWANESYYRRVDPNFYHELCSTIFSTRLLPKADQAEKCLQAVLGINGDGVSPLKPGDDESERESHCTSTERCEEYAPHDIREVFEEISGNTSNSAGLEMEVASFEYAPAMTIHKFQTLQDRRVPVLIKYTGGGGFKRYFEETTGVLKKHFPDVTIDREIVEATSTREEGVFDILVDGKLVWTKRRGKLGVFLHMETIDQAIRKARQRRRPGAVVYGDKETYKNARLPLRDSRDSDGGGEAAPRNESK